jgi:hypothetical protein
VTLIVAKYTWSRRKEENTRQIGDLGLQKEVGGGLSEGVEYKWRKSEKMRRKGR